MWSLNEVRAFWKREREQRRVIARICFHGMLDISKRDGTFAGPHPDSKRTKSSKQRAIAYRVSRRVKEAI